MRLLPHPMANHGLATLDGVKAQEFPRPRLRRWSIVGLGLAVVLVLAGCGGPSQDEAIPGPSPAIPPPTSALPPPTGGPGVGQPLPQVNCTKQATDAASMEAVLASAVPGDRICLSGDMRDTRLDVQRSGTFEQPIIILGGGRTVTDGITVEADHVLVDGVAAEQPEAPGMYLRGNNITVQNNSVISPQGDDGDGIRFFGRDIRILHNLIRDTDGAGDDSNHADAIQTFATTDEYVASQNILIDGNRFEQIDNICLIAEGPDSESGGSGDGEAKNLVFTNNYCENGTGEADIAQAVYVNDFENVTIANNQIVGEVTKAFSFDNGSTGALVRDNQLNPAIQFAVGMSDSSEEGYRGPEPDGGP